MSTAVSAGAQNPVASTAPNYPKHPEQLRTVWHREQERRVLIAVLPYWINGEYDAAKPLPQTVAQWLQQNKYIAHSFGQITTVAPNMRAVTASRFGDPDLLNTGNPWQDKMNALPQLLASLSASQWRQIASPQGLGANSLSGDQKTLWEVVVPSPFSFDRTTTPYYARQTPPENIRTLTETERKQVRIRIKLISGAHAQLADGRGRFPVLFAKNQYEHGRKGETFLRMREPGRYGEANKTDDSGISAYGQEVLRYEPMRPKLLPASFEEKLSAAPITLAERSAEKPLTSGELLDSIGAATGLNLYLDATARRAPVLIVNNGSVAADDLLRAFLFATDSTVRVLPPAHTGEQPLYVVARNNEPLGRIEGRRTDWETSTESTQRGSQEAADERIKAQDPVSLLHFDADDPLPLSGDLLERVFAAARHTASGIASSPDSRVSVPLFELPVSAQKEINDKAKALASESDSQYDFRVRVEKVDVDCSVWMSYIAPGSGSLAGEIDAEPVTNIDSWMNGAKTEAATVKGRILIVSADTEDEAQELVNAARTAKAKEVWIQGTPDSVAAAVRVAGDMPIRAAVSLFRVAKDTPPELPRDENIYGKRSREWLLPDDPQVVRYAVHRIQSVAAVPGIVGIVLRDGVPPGYRGSNESTTEEAWSGESGTGYGGTERALGYKLARRRAYVQEAGSDPADIITALEQGSPGNAWHAWIRKQITPLWKELRTATGDNAVLMEGESTFHTVHSRYLDGMETFVPWERKDAEPPFVALFRNTQAYFPNLASSPDAFAVIVGNPNTRLTAEELLKLLKRDDKPETTIWDLTDTSIPGVGEQIRALKKGAAKP